MLIWQGCAGPVGNRKGPRPTSGGRGYGRSAGRGRFHPCNRDIAGGGGRQVAVLVRFGPQEGDRVRRSADRHELEVAAISHLHRRPVTPNPSTDPTPRVASRLRAPRLSIAESGDGYQADIYPTFYPTTRDPVPSGCFHHQPADLRKRLTSSGWLSPFPAHFRTRNA